MSQENATDRFDPYSDLNPPPSMDAALARRTDLGASIESISAQLEHRTAADCQSVEEFWDWKKRAEKALGFYRFQLHFLNRWVKLNQHDHRPENLAELERLVGTICKGIRRGYEPCYSQEQPPTDIEMAKAQMYKIVEIQHSFLGHFQSFNDAAKRLGVGEKSKPHLRKPLVDLQAQVRSEGEIVASFLRSNNTSWRARSAFPDWAEFLLGLVDRAVGEGFALSEEDLGKIAQIKEAKGLSSQ